MRRHVCPALAFALTVCPALAAGDAPARVDQERWTLSSSEPVVPGISPAVRDLPAAAPEPLLTREINPRENPHADEPDQGRRGTWDRVSVPRDPLVDGGINPASRTPALDFSFDATSNPTGCGSCTPPDVVGDVGPNHYIHMVNATKVAIYGKTGTLLQPAFNLGTLWTSGNCASNAGDPIPVYDSIADRWVLAQFASPSHMCIAVSQTPDPQGSYYTYTFNVGSFPDYFKLGVWPDGYYMAANESTYTAYAFDRARMLTGLSATFQKVTGGTNLYLPSDIDGPTLPPAGAPNHFYTFKDNSYHGGGADRVEVRDYDVDWVTPANSTFTLVATLNVASFTYTPCGFFNFNCVRQLGTTQRFDALGEWPMHRFPYRNFGTHQTLVGTYGVGGGSGNVGAAIRWFELRNSGGTWTLYQEGTFDPGDGHDRVNASIAMDRQGNIALGYTVSSNTINPGIRYVTRAVGDPLGTMGTEQVLQAGGGSQTGSNRWGDYSDMSVDPADDCRFYFTNEYYSSNSSNQWKTKVGAFTVPGCRCASTITLSPATLPNGTVGASYVQTITAAGGTGPYTYAVTAGTLPAGLSLSSGGILSGTPSAAGTSNFTVTATDSLGCTGSQAYTIVVTTTCGTITLSPATLPNGTVGASYVQTITAAGGTGPYTYAVTTGTLPAGLSLSSGGVLSGTPSAAGTSNFTVTATDSLGCTGSRAYTIVVTITCGTITLSPATLPGGTAGSAYGQTITASGGSAPYTFAVTAGALPGGLGLSSGGVLSGTPTATGTFGFTVTATDASGCTGNRPYSITIGCGTITIAPGVLPNGTVGIAYGVTLTASGGLAPYTFVLTGGALPPGLTLSSGGVISGTPTAQGTFTFDVGATDAAACTGSASFVLAIDCPGLTLAPASLPAGDVGVAYSQTIVASGGTPPYTYAVTSGALPPGLALAAATGILSGTPTSGGTYTFTVQATDAASCTVSQGYSILVNGPVCGTIVLSPATLPAGAEGLSYAATITASGGTAPYTFAVTSGSLPPGLALAGTGALSGTPAAAGTYAFTVTATDAAACTASQGYTVVIGPAVDFVVGEGLGQPNGNRVRVYTRDGAAAPVSFLAYGAGQWGTNVSAGNVNGATYGEILTGPGPGAVYGPHVRGFRADGTALAKISFYAYGTLRYGVNVGAGAIDGDAFAEILTGAGPGDVFGPHVRAFDYDNVTIAALAKVSYFAYGSLRFGVNVEDGNVDGDGFAEILTGPGPSSAFGPTVRGWNYDGVTLAAIGAINFNAYGTLQYGVNVAGDDADSDGFAEIGTAPGPGPALSSQFRGFDYDATAVAPAPGFDVTSFTSTRFGGRVGLGDLRADGNADLVAGAGRDPAASAQVEAYAYDGVALTLMPGSFLPFSGSYGVNVGAGALGHY